MGRLRASSVMFVAASALLLASASAHAGGERQACMTAAEQAQSLRDSGKYGDARKQLLVCVRDVCPAFVKKDCTEWLSQLESVAPSVVFGAKVGSRDLVDVRVLVDGKLALEKLEGTPVTIDPGPHTFKFEWANQTREEQVVVSAGQKGRNIVATFGSTEASAASTTPAAPAAGSPVAASPAAEKPGRGSLVPALVVGGVGVIALGSFAIFAISGKSEKSDLEASCKPRCASDDVDGTRTKFIVADVSLGVGLVALGVSTYMILKRSKADGAPVKTGLRSIELDLGPTRGGAAGSLGARF